MHGGQADDLGHVQCGTAAKADHAVGVVRLVSGSAIHHLAAGGVAKYAAEHGHVQTAQMGDELGHHGQHAQRLVGNDQRALAAHFQQMRGDQLARAGAEFDGGGKVEGRNAHGDGG